MQTEISSEHTIILAKRRHIEELERLIICTEFVELIGEMIHQIQAERGASCLYLASGGQRFAKERADIVAGNAPLDIRFRQGLQRHLDANPQADAKQLTLVSWILLGFDQLTVLRHQVTLQQISFIDCIQAFTRLIGSLVSLIFEITDTTVNSKISSSLLALYNLVQGKEFAGQERAVGAHMFGSGNVQLEHQQKVMELMALQERHFESFNQFATPALRNTWVRTSLTDTQRKFLQYQSKLTSASPGQTLQPKDGDCWFELCSQRLTDFWQIQCLLISDMHQALKSLLQDAQQDLENTRQHLQQLRDKAKVPGRDSAFFNLSIPVEHSYGFLTDKANQPYPIESVISLLQQQSQQIAEMESELSETKKALTERKQIERAKGLLMSTLGLTEVEAYQSMRSTAMEQKRKIIDVAENILFQHKQAS
jgi:prefoldin subunit 5